MAVYVCLRGHDFKYEIKDVIHLFYKDEDIVYVDEPPADKTGVFICSDLDAVCSRFDAFSNRLNAGSRRRNNSSSHRNCSSPRDSRSVIKQLVKMFSIPCRK